MACGVPIIADRRGGIPEVAPAECPSIRLLENGNNKTWRSEEYQNAVVAAVDEFLSNPPDTGPARDAARGRDASAAAWQWERNLDDFFETRYRSNRVGVLRQTVADDNFVHARILASDLRAEGAGTPETEEIAALAERVINQEEQTAEDYASLAISIEQELGSSRFKSMIESLLTPHAEKGRTLRALDVACGNGSFAIMLARAAKEAGVTLDLTLVDYAGPLLEAARPILASEKPDDWPPYRFIARDAQETLADLARDNERFDIVFCGEFIEHVEEPHLLIDRLLAVAAEGGTVGITTPAGPIQDLIPVHERKRGHTHNFTSKHVVRLLRGQEDITVGFVTWPGLSPYTGRTIGQWLITWTPVPGVKSTSVDYRADLAVMRPLERLTACIIAKDAEEYIGGCLKTLSCADAVHVYDTGSKDATKDIARRHGAIVHDGFWDDDFAAARNRLLDLVRDESDWILWIDCDERLVGGHDLRHMIESPLALAFAIKQHHLHIDIDKFHDLPCRVFRAHSDPEIRFHGAVHEQPALDETGTPLVPAVGLDSVDIAHYGYTHANQRMAKLNRNHVIMQNKEIAADSPRTLSWALWLRDLCQRAEWSKDPERKRRLYATIVRVWREKGWDKPEHDPIHAKVAWPSYQMALAGLKVGFRVRSGLAVEKVGTPETPRIKPESFLAFDVEDAERQIAWRTKQVLDAHRGKPPLLVRP